MKRLILTSCSAILLSALSGCGQRGDSEDIAAVSTSEPSVRSESKSDLPIHGMAPDWSLKRLDGSVLDSGDLKGKVVVIDFWATWCPPCRAEIPGYIGMQEDLEDQGLVIVGLSLDEKGPGVVREFAERFGVNYEMVMADENIVDAFGGMRVIPTTFLIDREGQVRHRKEGMMHREEYEPLIKSLL